MAVADTDIKFYYSGDGTAKGSLGGAITENEVPSSGTNIIFDNVDASEAESGDVEYRCIYIKNTHPSDTLYDARVFIAQDTVSEDDEIDIGLDSAGKNGTATSIADESTAPSGVTFSHPTTYDDGLQLGDLGPGEYYAIWIRRTVNAGASALANNNYMIKVQGQTA